MDNHYSRKPLSTWTMEDVTDWARNVLKFEEADVAVLIAKDLKGSRLLLVPNVDKLESYGMSSAAFELWAEIEKAREEVQNSLKKRKRTQLDDDDDEQNESDRASKKQKIERMIHSKHVMYSRLQLEAYRRGL
jgi:hypothetical protein